MEKNVERILALRLQIIASMSPEEVNEYVQQQGNRRALFDCRYEEPEQSPPEQGIWPMNWG